MAMPSKLKKKKAQRAPRMPKSMEEKHVGSERLDWDDVTDLETAVRDGYRYYN